jgi:hypothetical protein
MRALRFVNERKRPFLWLSFCYLREMRALHWLCI